MAQQICRNCAHGKMACPRRGANSIKLPLSSVNIQILNHGIANFIGHKELWQLPPNWESTPVWPTGNPAKVTNLPKDLTLRRSSLRRTAVFFQVSSMGNDSLL